MRIPHTETLTIGDMEWKYTRHKLTIDEDIYRVDDHYIGYDRPIDYHYPNEKGFAPSEGIKIIAVDSIFDAYNDYKLSLEF